MIYDILNGKIMDVPANVIGTMIGSGSGGGSSEGESNIVKYDITSGATAAQIQSVCDTIPNDLGGKIHAVHFPAGTYDIGSARIGCTARSNGRVLLYGDGKDTTTITGSNKDGIWNDSGTSAALEVRKITIAHNSAENNAITIWFAGPSLYIKDCKISCYTTGSYIRMLQTTEGMSPHLITIDNSELVTAGTPGGNDKVILFEWNTDASIFLNAVTFTGGSTTFGLIDGSGMFCTYKNCTGLPSSQGGNGYYCYQQEAKGTMSLDRFYTDLTLLEAL